VAKMGQDRAVWKTSLRGISLWVAPPFLIFGPHLTQKSELCSTAVSEILQAGFLEILESPGILFWHFQDWKVLENECRSWKVLEIHKLL